VYEALSYCMQGEDTCGQLGMRGLQAARSPTLLRDLAVTGNTARNAPHMRP